MVNTIPFLLEASFSDVDLEMLSDKLHRNTWLTTPNKRLKMQLDAELSYNYNDGTVLSFKKNET